MNAPKGLQQSLLQAASRQHKTYPNIATIYYSLPDWLTIFDLLPRYSARTVESIATEYRFIADRYHSKVADVLDDRIGIAAYATGRALLQEIAANSPHSLRIMPNWHWKLVLLPGPFNSTPRPVNKGETLAHVSDGTATVDADAYTKGEPIRDDDSQPVGLTKGTGKGADVVLYYSPENWEVKDRTNGPGFEPDEVMFHELVHVTRMLRGKLTLFPVTGGGGYRNEDEYLATTIANLYLSEKGKNLRGAYREEGANKSRVRKIEIGGKVRFRVVDPPPRDWRVMKDPDKFYQNPDKTSMSPRELIKRFSDTQKAFYDALRRLPDGKPKFNPVKQHYRENLRPDI
jgi:hypothetical protein